MNQSNFQYDKNYNEYLNEYVPKTNKDDISDPSGTNSACAISQPNNALLTYQKISNTVKEFKKNAKRQLEQADELKGQLKQLKRLLKQQQQSPSMPRLPHNINRTRYRTHPYLYNEHAPSYTQTIPATIPDAPTDYNNTLSNNPHSQQEVAATGDEV